MRTWLPAERRWVADQSRGCATCGAPVRPQNGRGRPFKYCDQHAPPLRGYMREYQAEHAEDIRHYQRQRYGYRPTRDRLCVTPDCGRRFRGFVELCPRCRQHAARQVAP